MIVVRTLFFLLSFGQMHANILCADTTNEDTATCSQDECKNTCLNSNLFCYVNGGVSCKRDYDWCIQSCPDRCPEKG